MARYRATIEGARGPASRLGHAGSGIETTANGWSGGVKVIGEPTKVGSDEDSFKIYATRGSGHGDSDGYLGTVIDGKFTPSDALRVRIIREWVEANKPRDMAEYFQAMARGEAVDP